MDAPAAGLPQTGINYCDNFNAGGCADRISGLIFGHAIGDAVGFTTEFVEDMPAHITFPYADSIRKVRNCDWTDDTDLLVLTMGSLMENNMKLISTDIAGRFIYWAHKGLIYAGDSEPKTPNPTFKYIVNKPDFATKPAEVAKSVLEESKGTLCNNSPMSRCIIAGTLPDPVQMAVDICAITHADSRCIASCVFVSCVLNSLIYSREHTAEGITRYIDRATTAAIEHLDASHHEEFRSQIARSFRAQTSNLKLGELARASNVYKCLSCVVYALHIIKTALAASITGKLIRPDFKKCIEKIALEGGDADANCAMVGAVLGCWMGYKKLPADWINVMPNGNSLSQFVAFYISRLFAPTTFEDNAAAVANEDEKSTTVEDNAAAVANVEEKSAELPPK
jgi:ADP-ribosylglycohydrolase